MDVFVSVGTGLSPEQEAFVSAVEARLKAVGCSPCTIGRNTFSADAPLRAVTDLMDRCSGVVVIAVERYWVQDGVERRGGARSKSLAGVGLATPWNQIEAAMAYSRGLPLLVLVDQSLRCDGLLEKGNDWFVHELPIDPAALNSVTFTGLLDSWRQRVAAPPSRPEPASDPSKMTIGALAGALGPAQLWAILGALTVLMGGAFTAGATVGKLIDPPESSKAAGEAAGK
ncbi:hypothetical protein [Brevundimonas lenta]|uniref:TIR domain-containing protein n=1 Tax=Brevundimonas lenta TaxID=424796 RepID=A0A7W6NMG4_9CAUL|nr:hypothetical protein [Brevundimonas lenta]MBB4081330.1 hypothetical protein [Brevundimonas lenta]